MSFVTRHRDRPFLLYLAFNAVHTPMHATDGRLRQFASITDPTRKTYAAMLAAMDEAVGRLLDALRSERLEENTLIFFLSDNGGPTIAGPPSMARGITRCEAPNARHLKGAFACRLSSSGKASWRPVRCMTNR